MQGARLIHRSGQVIKVVVFLFSTGKVVDIYAKFDVIVSYYCAPGVW